MANMKTHLTHCVYNLALAKYANSVVNYYYFFLIKTERVVGSVMVMTLNHGAVMFMAQA